MLHRPRTGFGWAAFSQQSQGRSSKRDPNPQLLASQQKAATENDPTLFEFQEWLRP
jgi:hypothetical protein